MISACEISVSRYGGEGSGKAYSNEAEVRMLAPSENGFTIVEVLIAMTIMSIGLIALASLAVTSMRATDGGKRMTQAIGLASNKLEALKAIPYSNLQNSGSDGGVVRACVPPANAAAAAKFSCKQALANGTADNIVTYGNMRFTWTWTVNYLDLDKDNTVYSDPANIATTNYAIDSADLKQVVVYVSWRDLLGQHTIQLSNVRTKL